MKKIGMIISNKKALKVIKKILIILFLFVNIVMLDTIQAFYFTRNPIFVFKKTTEDYGIVKRGFIVKVITYCDGSIEVHSPFKDFNLNKDIVAKCEK